MLGIIVAIRVVLSFSLEVETDGMWPWNRWRVPLRRTRDRRLTADKPARFVQHCPDGDDHRSRLPPEQVPRGARQAAAAGRQRPVPGADGPVRALRSTTRTSTRTERAPIVDRRHRRADRRRLRRAVHRRAAEAGRASTTCASSRAAATSAARWYWNRYPGAMCDTAAMVYLPLLEETGHMPTQKYVMAPEIFGHASASRKTFGLYDDAIFSTAGHATSSGTPTRRAGSSAPTAATRSRARFVAMGTGPLNRRSCPASRASRRSPATRSTRAAGTTATPAATRPARR